MDPDHEAVVAAAHQWAVARREREVNAVIAWSRRRRARAGVVPGFEAIVASAHSRGVWYPAWSRHPAAVTASATAPARGTVRCRCGDPEPCECTILADEVRQAEELDHPRQIVAGARTSAARPPDHQRRDDARTREGAL